MYPAILKTPLSAVKNVHSKNTQPLTLGDALNSITGEKYASMIAEIRQLQETGQIAEAKLLKKKTLPAIIFAGTFSKRNNESLVRHSGLMVLDFDDCGTESKQALANDPHALLCFVSPRGTGLKLVIRVDATNANEHGECFNIAQDYFRERYQVKADDSGKDVVRLCFFSHDPEAIFHPEAEVLHRPYRQHRPYKTTQENIDNVSNREGKGGNPPPPTHTIDEILSLTQPTQPGQRHRQIFSLARGLRFECGLSNEPFSQLKPIVRRWFDMAKDKIHTQDFSESWSDFVHAWQRAKSPLSSNTLAAAWDAVQVGDLPAVAKEYDAPKIQSLVGLCWHLGKERETFYLSTHKAGPLLGVKPMQVLRWLRMLEADEILTLVKKGTQKLASTYRWVHGEKS